MPNLVPFKNILLVEDDPDIRETMKQLLQSEGHEVTVAENGQVALEILNKIRRPNLILLDVMMPVMNGLAFLAEKNKMESIQSIPVILISAGHRPDSTAGAVAFLHKPVEMKVLLEVIIKHAK
jgi:CheY-like chemotaxis protein